MRKQIYIVDPSALGRLQLEERLQSETDFEISTFSSVKEAEQARQDGNWPHAMLVACRSSSAESLAFLTALPEEVVGFAMTPSSEPEQEARAILQLGPLRVSGLPWQNGCLLPKLHAALQLQEAKRELGVAKQELSRQDAQLRESKSFAVQSREELRAKHDVLQTATARLVEAEQLAAVGRVVTGIAHEISNQLALVGYAEAIKSRVANDSELFEFADAIVVAQRRLATMVDQIRTFASSNHNLDAAAESPDFEVASLAAVVEEALGILRYDKDVRRRVISCHFEAHPLVRLKREQWDQVVINLVSNAVLATRVGGRIELSLTQDEERGIARLTVTDHGEGMAPEVVQRLGEPFFTTRGHRSSGLGIGICMSIARAHGGGIRYASELGKGTQAIVEIPLYAEER